MMNNRKKNRKECFNPQVVLIAFDIAGPKANCRVIALSDTDWYWISITPYGLSIKILLDEPQLLV